MVGAGRVDAVLVGDDDLPELGADLVAALTGLDVDEFTHLEGVVVGCVGDWALFPTLRLLMLVMMDTGLDHIKLLEPLPTAKNRSITNTPTQYY